MNPERQAVARRMRFRKWAGLHLGALAAFLDQQVVSISVFARCPDNSPALVLGVGVVCAVIGLVGAFISWRLRQSLPAAETAGATDKTDRFIASLSVVLALTFVLYILFATTAGIILRCERI